MSALSKGLDVLRKAESLLKKIDPSDIPFPKSKPGGTPLPPAVATKNADERVPAQGVLTFKDAVAAVDQVLLKGLFDWEGDSVEEFADQIVDKILDFAGLTSDEDQADKIYSLMRKKILSQDAPKVRVKVTSIRKRKRA